MGGVWAAYGRKWFGVCVQAESSSTKCQNLRSKWNPKWNLLVGWGLDANFFFQMYVNPGFNRTLPYIYILEEGPPSGWKHEFVCIAQIYYVSDGRLFVWCLCGVSAISGYIQSPVRWLGLELLFGWAICFVCLVLMTCCRWRAPGSIGCGVVGIRMDKSSRTNCLEESVLNQLC